MNTTLIASRFGDAVLPPIVSFGIGIPCGYGLVLMFASSTVLREMATNIGTTKPFVARLIAALLFVGLAAAYIGWIKVVMADYQSGKGELQFLISLATFPIGALLGALIGYTETHRGSQPSAPSTNQVQDIKQQPTDGQSEK